MNYNIYKYIFFKEKKIHFSCIILCWGKGKKKEINKTFPRESNTEVHKPVHALVDLGWNSRIKSSYRHIMTKLWEKLEESEYIRKEITNKLWIKIWYFILIWKKKKKNTSTREETKQKVSFGWTYHQLFLISHKLQDASRWVT